MNKNALVRHDPHPWPKVNCKTCGLYKRQYGKGVCRACYKVKERSRLAEARKRALERVLRGLGAFNPDGR